MLAKYPALSLIGGAGLIAPEILGVGYDSVSYWLHGGSDAVGTSTAFFVKLLAFVIAISGGIIAEVLYTARNPFVRVTGPAAQEGKN